MQISFQDTNILKFINHPSKSTTTNPTHAVPVQKWEQRQSSTGRSR